MQRGIAILLSLTVTACFTGTVFGQAPHTIVFTMDPKKNVPTMVAVTKTNAPIVFRSANFTSPPPGGPPKQFTLVFPPGFAGQFVDGGTGDGQNSTLSADTIRPNGDIAFTSEVQINATPPICKHVEGGSIYDCQWVRIHLKPPTPPATEVDFVYKVEMGSWGQVIDPRIRGR
jgi:hypothetical protein